MSTPRSALDDIIKTVAMRAAHEQKDDVNAIPRAASFTSSQMATTSNGFDSSTISTTGSTGSTVTDLGVVGRGVKRASIEPTGSTGSTVNDLGVVGRGVKRASIKPISAEPSSKKPALDSPSPQVGSSNKSEVATAQNGDDAVSK
jgi:HAT1-interacting factor 1